MFQQNHREMLEIQLVHSRTTREGICPVFTPSVGVEALHQYAERNQDELETLGMVKFVTCSFIVTPVLRLA